MPTKTPATDRLYAKAKKLAAAKKAAPKKRAAKAAPKKKASARRPQGSMSVFNKNQRKQLEEMGVLDKPKKK